MKFRSLWNVIDPFANWFSETRSSRVSSFPLPSPSQPLSQRSCSRNREFDRKCAVSPQILASRCFRISTSLDVSCVTKKLQAQRKCRTSHYVLISPSRCFFLASDAIRQSSRRARSTIKVKKYHRVLRYSLPAYVRRRSKVPEDARDYTDIRFPPPPLF